MRAGERFGRSRLTREGGSTATEDEGDEEEPRTRFRLRCSRRLRRLWGTVFELAQRMAGSQLSQGQAAEVIAAEGLAARPASEEAWPARGSVAPPPADPAETRGVFADLDWTAVVEAIPEDVEQLANGVEHLDANASTPA